MLNERNEMCNLIFHSIIEKDIDESYRLKF